MILFRKYYLFLLIVLVSGCYFYTLAPGVIQIDSGELAAVQSTLGIAHPSGYPLFTMLGYVFLQIPFGSKIFLANLLAAIFCVLGIIFFARSAKLILDNLEKFNSPKIISQKNKRKKESKTVEVSIPYISETKKVLAVFFGSLVLAFSKTFWFQSTSVEVYSLHIFLILISIYFLLKAFLKEENDFSAWIIFAISLALSFANHLTSILMLPPAAYLYFSKHKSNKISVNKILILSAVFFAIFILIYLYLPVRASQSPELNWGNPVSFEKLLRHISGKQYQVWLFSSTESAQKQLNYFVRNLPDEFAKLGLLFSLFGFVISFRYARKIFRLFLISFIITIFYSINYDIADIDAYFLLAYISLGFFGVFGIIQLLNFLRLKGETYTLPAILLAVFVFIQIFINVKKVNQNDVYIFEDYTKSILNSTEKNGIILSYQWDYFISQSYYFQFAENFRKDVVIIDKELLRRSWYYDQLENNFPDLMKELKTEISLFKNAVAPFERDENYDAALLENLYRRIIAKLIETGIKQNRDFYIAPELIEDELKSGELTLPQGYTVIPDLFLFKVVPENKYVAAPPPNFNLRFPENRNVYTNNIERFVGAMLVRRAVYETNFNKKDKAKIYFEKVKNDFPGFQIPYQLDEVIK